MAISAAGVSNHRLDRIRTPPSVAIADRARALRASGIAVATLQTGEPSFDTPRYICDAAYDAMLRGDTHYSESQGLTDLRQAIAADCARTWGVTVAPSNVIIGCGAVHSIYSILSALLGDGDEVLIIEPYWPQYAFITTLANGKPVAVDTSASAGRVNADSLERAVTDRTRLIVLNNPTNPTGVVYGAREISDILDMAAARDLIVLFDEVYAGLVYSSDFCSVFAAPNFAAHRERICYVNSFSKTYAMTGWRVGYSIVPDRFVGPVLKIAQNTVTNVATFAQRAAAAAINGRSAHADEFAAMYATYAARREQLIALLERRGLRFIRPDGAFYFFIDCGESSDEFAARLLEENRIAVVPGSAYGEHWKQYYRISYAVDESSFDSFVQYLST